MNTPSSSSSRISQNKKKKKKKKRLTQDQVGVLEESFGWNKKLDPELKIQLSRQLGIPPRRIAIWYQNKRVRWKKQSLELEYNTLLRRLENATVQKTLLQTEANRLLTHLHIHNANTPLTQTCNNHSANHDQRLIDYASSIMPAHDFASNLFF